MPVSDLDTRLQTTISRPFSSMKKFVLFLSFMFGLSFSIAADMITNTGAEMRVFFDDASKLTPEQLTLLRDMQKDQLTAAQDLMQMDSARVLEQRKVEADSALAHSVVTVAGALVMVLIVVLLITIRRPSVSAPTVHVIEATRQLAALPAVRVYEALPVQQSLVRREE